jgi:hypothetical protein
MLGYEPTRKAYRVWDIEEKMVKSTRDVRFEEGTFPFKLPKFS